MSPLNSMTALNDLYGCLFLFVCLFCCCFFFNKYSRNMDYMSAFLEICHNLWHFDIAFDFDLLFFIITVRTILLSVAIHIPHSTCPSCFVKGDWDHWGINVLGVPFLSFLLLPWCIFLFSYFPAKVSSSSSPPFLLVILILTSTCFSSNPLHPSSPLFTCSSVATVITVIMLQLGQPVLRTGNKGFPIIRYCSQKAFSTPTTHTKQHVKKDTI